MLVNRRPEFRKDAFKFGTVRREGAVDLPCLVWDLSSMGAKIEIADSDAAPDAFTLLVGEEGQPIPCKAIWRSGPKIGVAFLWASPALKA